MGNREARQLAKGDGVRPVATAMGHGRFSKRFTHTVAYVGGPAFSPWIVTTDALQFAPWEVERTGAEARQGARPTALTAVAQETKHEAR